MKSLVIFAALLVSSSAFATRLIPPLLVASAGKLSKCEVYANRVTKTVGRARPTSRAIALDLAAIAADIKQATLDSRDPSNYARALHAREQVPAIRHVAISSRGGSPIEVVLREDSSSVVTLKTPAGRRLLEVLRNACGVTDQQGR